MPFRGGNNHSHTDIHTDRKTERQKDRLDNISYGFV